MSIAININSLDAAVVARFAARPSSRVESLPAAPAEQDTVEFSPAGQALARAAERSSFRIARVRAVAAEIAAGTYETPDRIGATVARLLDVLG